MKDFARNLTKSMLWGLATIIVLLFCAWLVLANYLACKQALDYQGYDQMPLAKEAFIGKILGPFFPDITVAHAYASGLAFFVAVGLFILYNRMFQVMYLARDRKVYVSSNDSANARIALDHIIYNILFISIFILPLLIPALNWDIDLYRFRSVVGALGLDDPSSAPRIVENWDIQLKKYGHLFAWQLAAVGGWGYVAVTGISCAALEFFARQTGESYERTANSWKLMVRPDERQAEPLLYGYDDHEQPIYDPAVPVAYDVSGNPVEFYGFDSEGYPVYDSQTRLAYDTGGNPILSSIDAEAVPADGDRTASAFEDHYGDEAEMREGTPSAVRQPQNETLQNQAAGVHETRRENANTQGSHAERAASGTSGHGRRPLFNDTEAFQNIGGRRNENTPLQAVIGKPEERIGITEALADKVRYWVDPDTLAVWDRDYRRILFPGTC